MGNRFLDVQLNSEKEQKQLLHALNQSYVRKWNEGMLAASRVCEMCLCVYSRVRGYLAYVGTEQQELVDKMRVLYSSITHSAAPDRYVSV